MINDNDSNELKVYIECVFGDCYGQKFALQDGINRIGKGYQMDICLTDDIQVTRDNHCSIICDMKEGKYVLTPTIGSLTYLNNALLKEPSEIKNEDMFRVGRSNFIFISK